MNFKTFILSFIVAYILISLPAIFGIGHVIDWVQQATFLQKFFGYIKEGLTNHYLIKIVISIIGSVIIGQFLSKRKANNNK